MIYELMSKRRSVRRFNETAPSKEILEKLIEAAVTAPSAGNRQLWRFIIVRDRDIITQAAEYVDATCEKTIPLIQPVFQPDFFQYSKNFRVIRNISTVIVPIYRPASTLADSLENNVSADVRNSFSALGRDGALISASMAAQNILLMAAELGLGACCMTGPLIARDQLNECFQVPKGWQIAVLIPIGYPDETPIAPKRKPANSVIKWK